VRAKMPLGNEEGSWGDGSSGHADRARLETWRPAAVIDSPIGRLGADASDRGVTRLCLLPADGASLHPALPIRRRARRYLEVLARQLAEYFDGRRHTFDVALDPTGTTFQRRAWDVVRRIPFGETWSYQEVARLLRQPHAPRAVGQANRRNPILLVIPCHRVIAADGTLGGYAVGEMLKRRLLAWEREGASLSKANEETGDFPQAVRSNPVCGSEKNFGKNF
jgi:methylated-DNA-[protein]-cysteine S-methyltransferase